MPKFKILLLTNRDSDNVGDQIIEASVISILKGIMKNLDIPSDGYEISSRAAGIISRAYMKTGDPALIESARKSISTSDVVVFGGAPLFNYTYQSFYLRTIRTLELAQEYGVPVLFSSIGVEPFDPNNAKSLELKKALALPCVRQITTRDDVDSARRYVEGTGVPVAHVADPAVLADIVFRKLTSALTPPPRERKKIGLVVTRAGIFKDNKIAFTAAKQKAFWLDTIALLESRGYDVRLFTTGHFSDEVFLDNMVRKDGVPLGKAAVTVNSPEELITELSTCDGVIAYRLHASITSFALGVPSVGLSWNFKVPYFYDSVGYRHRALDPADWTAEKAVSAIESAMADGIRKDEPFLTSVYDTLFAGIKEIAAPTSARVPFTLEELKNELPPYAGTTLAQYREKMRRKLRRTYENYQILTEQVARLS
ncbi:MAG: polysaccharide pyruvyl transferase family protein [Microbacterium sp.]